MHDIGSLMHERGSQIRGGLCLVHGSFEGSSPGARGLRGLEASVPWSFIGAAPEVIYCPCSTSAGDCAVHNTTEKAYIFLLL